MKKFDREITVVVRVGSSYEATAFTSLTSALHQFKYKAVQVTVKKVEREK